MGRIAAFTVLLLAVTVIAGAQSLKTKNIIVITLDGYRWHELFKGADPEILSNKRYTKHKDVGAQFDGETSLGRRQKLMPFFWNTIAVQGQLYGNREFDNKVNCSNNYLISYPGYSEMFVGFADRTVDSNKKRVNPNPTVLEQINHQDDFYHRVAAFATWDAFPFILREKEADFYVNAGTEIASGNISEAEQRLNEMQATQKKRSDETTFQFAIEYLKRERPRVLFIGFDDTDRYGHEGEYDNYLIAAHEADQRIASLWNWIQTQPDYKDQTTLLITTDHGRGNGKNIWTNHRLFATGSRHIWFAVLGPDTPAFGEMRTDAKYYQKQIAHTIAAFLGVEYKTERPAGEVVQTMLAFPLNSIAPGEGPVSKNQ